MRLWTVAAPLGNLVGAGFNRSTISFSALHLATPQQCTPWVLPEAHLLLDEHCLWNSASGQDLAQWEARFNASAAHTQKNASTYVFCLKLILKGTIQPSCDLLQNLECFVKFSCYLSHFSLTMRERLLVSPSLSIIFRNAFTITTTNQIHLDIFRRVYSNQRVEQYKKNNRVESLQHFLFFLTVIGCNASRSQSFVLQFLKFGDELPAEDWIRAEMPADQILEKLGNGRARKICFLELRMDAPALPNHKDLEFPTAFVTTCWYKTSVHAWKNMRNETTPSSWTGLWYSPVSKKISLSSSTFRHSGSKFILFSVNIETNAALRAARETPNGYIRSEDTCIHRVAGVEDLDGPGWLWHQERFGTVQAEHLLT